MTELQVKSLIINDEIAKKLFFDGHFWPFWAVFYDFVRCAGPM